MFKTQFRKPFVISISNEELEHENLTVSDENIIDKKAFKYLLKQKVHALDYNHKTVFILRFNERFSLKDIADITETSLGTVKSRLFYATKKITKELNDYSPLNETNLFKINYGQAIII